MLILNMEIDIRTVIKYAIVYSLFVLGIAILSEWINHKMRSCMYMDSVDKQYSLILDTTLEELKQKIKEEYMTRFRKINKKNEYLIQESSAKTPQAETEHFSNYDSVVSKDEKKLMDEVEEKLKSQNFLLRYPHEAFGRVPLHESYKKVDRKVNWKDPVETQFPQKNSTEFGDKYIAYAGQKKVEPMDKNEMLFSLF